MEEILALKKWKPETIADLQNLINQDGVDPKEKAALNTILDRIESESIVSNTTQTTPPKPKTTTAVGDFLNINHPSNTYLDKSNQYTQ